MNLLAGRPKISFQASVNWDLSAVGCYNAEIYMSLKSEKNLRTKAPSGPIKHKITG